MPCPTSNFFPDIVAVAVCGQWRLAGVPQSIAMPANGCDVGASICTAIPLRGEVFCCALHLAYLTITKPVR